MGTRKYISEFGLNSFATYRMLLQQDDLDHPELIQFQPHIYLICRRPRITLAPETVKFTNGQVSGKFNIQRRDKIESVDFETANYLETEDVSIECEYPYTFFKMVTPEGKSLLYGKSAVLFAHIMRNRSNLLNLEVLYVGQAYGTDGKRTAPDRLKSHSTLQNIYFEAIRNAPDQDIWLVLCSFKPLLLGSFDGRSKTYGVTDEEDDAHIKRVLSEPIQEQHQINFTEAALIKYFQPEYNRIYKDTFPNPAHSTYSACYDIDLNMVNVEIQTEELMCRLWSPNAEPRWTHHASFALHSREERKYMFEIS